MTDEARSVLEEALKLNPIDRAQLIDALFHSFDQKGDDQIDRLWANEAESRIDAYEAGELSADSVDNVFERIERAMTKSSLSL